MKYSKRNCTMRYLQEFKALGTAGGLYYFRNEIISADSDSFLVIHGDVVCSFPLQDFVDDYNSKSESSKLDALLFGVKVNDYDLFLALNDREQSSFGTIIYDKGSSKVVHYVEKPETRMSEVINGGIYMFNNNLFKRLSKAKVSKITTANETSEFVDEDVISMEKDILQNLPEYGHTFVYIYNNFWTAVKTPSDALYANELYLSEAFKASKAAIKGHKRTPTIDQINLEEASPHIKSPVFISPKTKVDLNAGTKIGPFVSIGHGCVIGEGARIVNSIILDNCIIGPDVYIANSIVSYNCKIGDWSRIEGTGIDMVALKALANSESNPEPRNDRVIGIRDSGNISILGSGTNVSNESYLLNSFILPNKTINHDVKYEIIM